MIPRPGLPPCRISEHPRIELPVLASRSVGHPSRQLLLLLPCVRRTDLRRGRRFGLVSSPSWLPLWFVAQQLLAQALKQIVWLAESCVVLQRRKRIYGTVPRPLVFSAHPAHNLDAYSVSPPLGSCSCFYPITAAPSLERAIAAQVTKVHVR